MERHGHQRVVEVLIALILTAVTLFVQTLFPAGSWYWLAVALLLFVVLIAYVRRDVWRKWLAEQKRINAARYLVGLVVLVSISAAVLLLGRRATKSPSTALQPKCPPFAITSLPEGIPPLWARLVVDSLHPKDRQFHLEITNTGRATAEEIQLSLTTGNATEFDLIPLGTRTLQSQKCLSISGLMFSDFANSRILTVATAFTYRPAQPVTTPSDITMRFKFNVGNGDITGRVFDPTTFSQESGNPLGEELVRTVLSGFAAPKGNLKLILFEVNKITGSMNHLHIISDRMEFIFDHFSRKVEF